MNDKEMIAKLEAQLDIIKQNEVLKAEVVRLQALVNYHISYRDFKEDQDD